MIGAGKYWSHLSLENVHEHSLPETPDYISQIVLWINEIVKKVIFWILIKIFMLLVL